MGSELEDYQRVIAGNVLDFALWGGLIGRLTLDDTSTLEDLPKFVRLVLLAADELVTGK